MKKVKQERMTYASASAASHTKHMKQTNTHTNQQISVHICIFFAKDINYVQIKCR